MGTANCICYFYCILGSILLFWQSQCCVRSILNPILSLMHPSRRSFAIMSFTFLAQISTDCLLYPTPQTFPNVLTLLSSSRSGMPKYCKQISNKSCILLGLIASLFISFQTDDEACCVLLLDVLRMDMYEIMNMC